MSKWTILMVVCSMAYPVVCAAQHTMDSGMKLFLRGVYFPFERTGWVAQKAGMEMWRFVDHLLGDLRRRYHIDAIWLVNSSYSDTRKVCELAEKHGIAVLATPESIYHWRRLRGQEWAERTARTAMEALGDLKALKAYVLVDEARGWEMAYMEQIRAALERLDPTRPVVMVNMTHDIDAVARYTRLPVLCSDIYPYFAARSPNGPNTPEASRSYFITCTEQLARLGSETGKAIWVMPQIFAEIWGKWHYDAQGNVVIEPEAYWHWRMPTVGETRWQIWQSLMAGAKGVIFFVLFPEPNDRSPAAPEGERTDIPADWPRTANTVQTGAGSGMLYSNGAPTPQLLTVAETFKALEPHRELLWRLKPAAPIASANAPFRTSTLIDPSDGSLVVVVINDDTERKQQRSVRLIAPAEQVQDLIAAKSLTTRLRPDTGEREVTLDLPPGGGALLRIEPAAARRIASVYYEDAAVQPTPAQIHNVQRVWQPHPWGMGFRAGWQPQGEQGWLQYEMGQVAGNWREGGERLYLFYEGSGVEISASADGKEFAPLAREDARNAVPLPGNTTHLRFVLTAPEAVLRSWQLVRVSRAE
ncbi:MAG: hypothetical protein RMM08_03910 [Armatimonadota bacterium]|nr:hypothetical protein [bacterium]MDW8320489.1 hypothetical protein [Armatimonadota bacterium]